MAEAATRGALLRVFGVIFGSLCIAILGTWLTAESEAPRQERREVTPFNHARTNGGQGLEVQAVPFVPAGLAELGDGSVTFE